MAARRNQPSTIKTLPPELVAEIDRLRTQAGWSIDRLVAFLADQGHERSRSAVGRHVRNLHIDVERAGAHLQRSAAISKALMDRFGDKPDNELARLNMQLLHGHVFDLLIGEDEQMGDDGGDQAAGEGGMMRDPLQLVRLSKVIQQLLSGEKMNSERIAQERRLGAEEERERQRAALEDAGRSGDIDAEAMAKAKRWLGFD